MTAPTTSSRSPIVLFLGVLAVAAVLVIAFFGQDDAAIGGPGDPDGTGPDGLLALRLLVEETGGSTIQDLGLPGTSVDVALLVFAPVPPVNIEDLQAPPPEPNWEPLLGWVEAGGVLITSVDLDGAPLGGGFEPDEDAIIGQGACTIGELSGVSEVRPRAYQRVATAGDDTQCFGDSSGSLVVSRLLGEGRIIRLGSAGALTNRALDDAENGAFAARLFGLENAPTVGFMSRAPVFFQTDADGNVLRNGDGEAIERTSPFGLDQPLDSEGNPIGSGSSGLLDLIPRSVIATIVALAASLLLYALARGRRLGSPIEEPLPIKLPSSSYVEAVGRSYSRVAHASTRSVNILRGDLRAEVARRVGLPAQTPTADLVRAINGNDELAALLDGTGPVDDEHLVSTARQLVDTRARLERGGVSLLATSDSPTRSAISTANTAQSTRTASAETNIDTQSEPRKDTP